MSRNHTYDADRNAKAVEQKAGEEASWPAYDVLVFELFMFSGQSKHVERRVGQRTANDAHICGCNFG